mgnify:CR=1 FL=1
MANKILLEYRTINPNTSINRDTKTEIIEVSLTSDISIDAQSEWQHASEFVPDFFQRIISLTRVFSAASGSANVGWTDFLNKLDAPMWKNTSPVKVQVQLGFYTKTDSYKDVVKPVTEIVGLTILSKDPNNPDRYILPGINLQNFSRFSSNASAANATSRDMKLISLEIPGIIYLPVALVESAKPTFSKEVTESSYPLWATIDTSFMGVAPASTDMFLKAQENVLLGAYAAEIAENRIKSLIN